MIKAKYEHIQDYPFEMQERIFKVMAYLWRKSDCQCGVYHRDISNPEHRKEMEANHWGPASKGPRWLYNFDNNALHMTYWCHGCKETFRKRFKHTEPFFVDRMYKLFEKHNPELLPELFTEENEHE